jgi:hypothetical protein
VNLSTQQGLMLKMQLCASMNKNYQSIIKQLTELLPQESAKSDDDDFDRFVSERDD